MQLQTENEAIRKNKKQNKTKPKDLYKNYKLQGDKNLKNILQQNRNEANHLKPIILGN